MTKENGKQHLFLHMQIFLMLFHMMQDNQSATWVHLFVPETQGGNIDEKDSGTINKKCFSPFVHGQLKAIIVFFVLSYTVMLWNCMTITASIDVKGLHNMYLDSSDSFTFAIVIAKLVRQKRKEINEFLIGLYYMHI